MHRFKHCRGRRSFAVLLLWAGMVFWYWYSFVPFAPSAVIPMGPEPNTWLTRGGQIAQSAVTSDGLAGPIRFLDPENGEQTQTLGPPGAPLKAISRFADVAAFQVGDNLQVLDLNSGDCTLETPLQGASQVAISDNGRYVAVYQYPGLELWEPGSKSREIWRKTIRVDGHPEWSDALDFQFVGSDLVKLIRPNSTAWWRVSTGEIDQRFSGVELIELSPDGRLVMLSEPFSDHVDICEYDDAHPLWSVPERFRSQGLHFTHDSARVSCFGDRVLLFGRKQSKLAQWDAWEGPNGPRPAIEDARVDVSTTHLWDGVAAGDGTRAIIIRISQPPQAPDFVVRSLAMLGIRWSGALGNVSDWGELVAQPGGRVLGRVVSGGLELLPTGDGVLVHDPESGRILSYPFAPSRDWSWLVKWLLMPPLLLAGVRWCYQQCRLRRQVGAEKRTADHVSRTQAADASPAAVTSDTPAHQT